MTLADTLRLVLESVLRIRWRRLRSEGKLTAVAIQMVTEIVLGAMWLAGLGRPHAPLILRFAVALWSGWIICAAITGWDGGWRFPLRSWLRQPGFWKSYIVATVLVPTGPLIVGGFIPALLAIILALRVSSGRVPLVALALVLFTAATLSLTSALRTLTRGAVRRARLIGYAAAVGVAAWNWGVDGIAPLHWVARVAIAPLGQAIAAIAGLVVALVLLTIAGGRLERQALVKGTADRRRGALGTRLLESEGCPRPLESVALLGWVRQWHLLVASAAYAWFFPIYWSVAHVRIELGVPIASCTMVLIFQCSVRANLLGVDGPGSWRYASAGVAPSEVLARHGAALAPLHLVLLLPTIAWAVAQRPGGWWGIMALGAYIFATIAIEDAAGQLVSRIWPESDWPQEAVTPGSIWFLIGHIAWSTLFALAVANIPVAGAARYWPVAVAVGCLAARAIIMRAIRRKIAAAWSAHVLTRLGAVIS